VLVGAFIPGTFSSIHMRTLAAILTNESTYSYRPTTDQRFSTT
jgi:hypothetical protein